MQAKCKFNMLEISCSWFTEVGKRYGCEVTSTEKAPLDKEIRLFQGKHKLGKTNNDIEFVIFLKQPIGFVPLNLQKEFPNLKYLFIEDCGIEKVSREDLKGLENLEYLSMSKNKLTSLPDDLFADMKTLKGISFADNKLERLSSDFLLPIEHTLHFASLQRNTRINKCFDIKQTTKSNFAKFKRIIDSKCLPPADRMLEEFSKFRSFGEFTDFTIPAYGKEFKVHKMVLAAQSSVCKKSFLDGEVPKPFSKIENYSEKTFEHFLDFFYTGKVAASTNIIEIYKLASEFDVAKLKLICTARILANMDESNAVISFNIAHRVASDLLKVKAFGFIKKMLPELDATFMNKLDEVNTLMALKAQMDGILKKN